MMKKAGMKAAIYGTLTADAAAMGLHWIYSQGKIAAVIKAHGGKPEFLDPDKKNYHGVPSFFAHPHKRAGDESNYGSYIYVLIKSMAENEGQFSVGNFIRCFQEYYGIGGEYVGYADHPMRETIYNITTISKELRTKVNQTSSELSDEKKDTVAQYIERYFFEHDSEELKKVVRNALKLHEFPRDEMAAVDKLVDAVADTAMITGTDDDQMPGLSRSALFAFLYSGQELDSQLEQAVRVTNDNDHCLAYALFMARVLANIYEDAGAEGAKQARLKDGVLKELNILPAPSQELMREGMSYDTLDYQSTTKKFGAACHVDMAIPLCLHILLNTESFEEAVRINILASGDSCGRAMFLGALAGAMYGIGGSRGIPESWITRTRLIPLIDAFAVL